MTQAGLFYLAGGLGILMTLSFMIYRIGTMMSDCPDGGPAARTAAISIATGFTAIGAGGILLIGAVLPLLSRLPVVAAFVALGFVTLCLGLGFTQAIATLRDVLTPRPKLRSAPAPARPSDADLDAFEDV